MQGVLAFITQEHEPLMHFTPFLMQFIFYRVPYLSITLLQWTVLTDHHSSSGKKLEPDLSKSSVTSQDDYLDLNFALNFDDYFKEF